MKLAVRADYNVGSFLGTMCIFWLHNLLHQPRMVTLALSSVNRHVDESADTWLMTTFTKGKQ